MNDLRSRLASPLSPSGSATAADAPQDSPITWWFFQGFYQTEAAVRHDFMLSLFRSQLEDRLDHEPSFQLLIANLGPEAKASHHACSWIDGTAVRQAIHRLSTPAEQLDPWIQQALVYELSHHGPPAPLQLKPPPAVLVPAPWEIVWESFRMQRLPQGYRLSWEPPGEGEALDVEIELDALLPIDAEGLSEALGPGMQYRCYPRSRLRGTTRSGVRVSGEVWVDHQWGNTDWFYQPEHRRWLGWDWFGLSLSDGSEWLVMSHWDAKTHQPVATHATCRRTDGGSQTVHRVKLTPLRTWQSPRTQIVYPVAWKIEIPECEATFLFEPMCDDQELAAFGPMRAVWEGAGRVTGGVGDERVEGRARGEFHGYGYLFDFHDHLARFGQRIDRRLEEFLPRSPTEADLIRFAGPPRWRYELAAFRECISRPVWDLIDRSGKRWRPIFGWLLLESFQITAEPYEAMLCAISELIHAGALIIDDIEDDSRLRRGDTCLHLRYGLDVALNAGNTLYALPGLAVIDHPLLADDQRRRISEIKERAFVAAHLGQATDIYWSRHLFSGQLRSWLADQPEEKILQMYAFKTGAALKAIAGIVAVIADLSDAAATAGGDFAEGLGVAYQIIDDVHNFSRDPEWTKVTGEDLANGKPTYVIVKALQRLEQAQSRRLEEILTNPELRSQSLALEEGIDLVIASGALEESRQVAQTMIRQAWQAFSPHLPSCDAKLMLHAMSMKLVELAYEP